MYLKRLDIQGFKSFADKISLDFNSGITSIVGPNGSGKSNVSDAVRWVLGEQSAKTLRGSKMEDVIFAGTEHRKPLGFAEVSITIDNSQLKLPVAYSEVTITRRVFRSGESEYLLNKTSCRLKDIYELLLDTGIGKDGYSIIGQGRVDEILSSRSEDRRLIFEEASGIMKYKVRKQEAEKKLDLTRQNLLRINDIVMELESQIEPLRLQSESARKFLDLNQDLKELEVSVYVDNISRMREKIQEQQSFFSSIKESMDAENNRLEHTTFSNKDKTDYLKELDEKLTLARELYYGIEGNIERCQSEISLNDEKISNLCANSKRLEEEALELDTRLINFEGDHQKRTTKLEYLTKQHDDFCSKLKDSEKKMADILETLNENERYIEELKAGIMDKLDSLSEKKTMVNNVKLFIDNAAKRKSHIDNDIYSLKLEKDRENMKKEELAESLRQASSKLNKANDLSNKLIIERQEYDKKLDELKHIENTIKSDIHVKTARKKMLSDMEQNLEGYNRSVKMVLQACREMPQLSEGIHGALAQLINVESKYEAAIEMALGGALQNIVTTTEEDAKKAIEFLKQRKLGRATFLPISAVKGKYVEEVTLREIKAMPGFRGIASELVIHDEKYKGIILNLLGRVVVVEDIDTGIRVAKKTGYVFRIVTMEGDIINTSGAMTGGSIENRNSGILSRSRDIEILSQEILKLVEDEQQNFLSLREIIHALEDIIKQLSQQENIIKEFELVKIREESHLRQVDENIMRAISKIEILNQDKLQLDKQVSEALLEKETYETQLKVSEDEIASTKQVVAQHQDKHKDGQGVRDALHEDITDYKISVNSILESIEAVKEALANIDNEKASIIKAISRKQAEKTRNENEVTHLQDKKIGLERHIKSLQEEKTGKTFEIDRIVEEKKVIDEELCDIVNEISEINKKIALLKEEYSKLEVKSAKLETEIEAAQNRMWDEYQLTYANAVTIKKEIGSLPQAQKQIIELKNDIKNLGHVNIGSIEEYVKTKERYEFMSNQKNDMEQAEEKLQKVIHEIVIIMKKQFMEQFNMINENFNEVFRQLFDGGRAALVLSDKDNVLESGIEIEVQPPGKKLQNMMLLSGGERAFTAIALLFAILKLRPSPFCILDEIEAALDDANVNRFSQYLRKFCEQTQFIMVTHRKGTMEGSDMLYGVTMQEHGISRVVSMKLQEAAS